MKKTASVLLIASFVLTCGLPVFAQKGRIEKKALKQAPLWEDTSGFARTEAFSEGKGALIRWRMNAERNNLGFYVYRVDQDGERAVSDLKPGSAFTNGKEPLVGGEYEHFDADGSTGSSYFIETHGVDGSRTRSLMVTTNYIADLRTVAGKSSADYRAIAAAAESNGQVVSEKLTLFPELRREVEANIVPDDLNTHRTVISRPGGVKIASKNTGVIRVTRAQLQSAGFDVNSDSNLWQLHLNGVEQGIIVGPNADYIDFIGKALDTMESDIRTYYLTRGTSPGRRIQSRVATRLGSSVVSPSYKQTFSRKLRTNYTPTVLNGGDVENYWGPPISQTPRDITFVLSGVDQTPGNRAMHIAFHGLTTVPHTVEVVLNGNTLPSATGDSNTPFSRNYSIPVSVLVEGTNTLTLRAPVAGDVSLFDSISIDFPRKHVAESNRINFYTDNYRIANLSGFSTANVRVFDVTNENEPAILSNLNVVPTGSTFGPVLPAARGRVYFAAEESAFTAPFSVLPNNPELIGVPTQAAQLVIITHKTLMTQAQNWANYRSGQGISVKVIEVDEVYDEFSFGTLTSYAVEDFLNYAKNNWQTPPSYVLLIGDASYDSRNYTGAGYLNMVPVRMVDTLYRETGSDEALADFNNDGLSEVAIGRIPSQTGVNVTSALTKTMNWESTLTTNSINRGFLFAFDEPNGWDFEGMSQRLAALLPASVPKTFVGRIIPVTPPDTPTTLVVNRINQGPYIANYSGHGSQSAWFDGSFFSSTQVPQLTNLSNPTVFLSLTCLNAQFMVPSGHSIAEVLLHHPNGGGVAVWASTGLTTPDVQEIMAARFFSQLGPGQIPRLGDMIMDAKMAIEGGDDVRLSWALIGDPMLKVR